MSGGEKKDCEFRESSPFEDGFARSPKAESIPTQRWQGWVHEVVIEIRVVVSRCRSSEKG